MVGNLCGERMGGWDANNNAHTVQLVKCGVFDLGLLSLQGLAMDKTRSDRLQSGVSA